MTEQPCPLCEINTGRAPATFDPGWAAKRRAQPAHTDDQET